ncbi:unnamed protein product, partial [Hymenolepis diminuta]
MKSAVPLFLLLLTFGHSYKCARHPDFKDHWQEARDVEAFANTVATEAFNHISSPVPNT